MRRYRALIAIAAFAALMPDVAEAHLVITGMGPVYDGMMHFGLSPEDYLPIVALAFFAGLCGALPARRALGALTLAWVIGGLGAMLGLSPPLIALSIATAVLFLAIGGLLAANIDVGPYGTAIAGTVLGFVRGLSGLDGTSFSTPHTLTLIGMAACAFVVFALAASLTLPLLRAWLIVAARVGGSWLAAIGLLLVGWIIRYGAAAMQ